MKDNDYYYIYRDLLGRYNTATSPRFIAAHKSCVAIPKDMVKYKYAKIIDFIHDLNTTITDNAKDVIMHTDLVDLVPYSTYRDDNDV